MQKSNKKRKLSEKQHWKKAKAKVQRNRSTMRLSRKNNPQHKKEDLTKMQTLYLVLQKRTTYISANTSSPTLLRSFMMTEIETTKK